LHFIAEEKFILYTSKWVIKSVSGQYGNRKQDHEELDEATLGLDNIEEKKLK
jgi:hypothetical protein